MSIKKGLGRGLESLFAMYDDNSDENIINKGEKNDGEKAVSEINIDMIQSNPNQPRKNFDQEALDDLACSIKVHGVIQPIVLNKMPGNKYMIIAGERRWRASKIAGLQTIPAVVKNYTDKQIKEISIIENLQREDLNPIEAARAIKQLMEEYKLTQETVSERIGKSRSNIANLLRLLNLYPEVVKMVENGKISAGHARCLVVIGDVNSQLRLANQVIKENWNVRDLEKAVKKETTPQIVKKIQKEEQSIELKELVSEMQRALSTKVSAIGNDNKGRIYIDYYSRDDLDRISDFIENIKKK